MQQIMQCSELFGLDGNPPQKCCLQQCGPGGQWTGPYSGLKHANAKRRVFWTQRAWTQALAPREASKTQEIIAMRFLNASVLERKSLNRNLSWGFPMGNLLPKTRVLERRVLERKREPNADAGKRKTYTGTSPPLFSKKAMQWGKKWPVQMNLPFFRCRSMCTGGVQNQAEKNAKKCLPAGTGTKIYFSRDASVLGTQRFRTLRTGPNMCCRAQPRRGGPEEEVRKCVTNGLNPCHMHIYPFTGECSRAGSKGAKQTELKRYTWRPG